ncbi:MAG TPA: aromatic ring-hydroxylating dioxygenase subunit alpha [Candidatus Eremiobacteraceae bacterium]|nr:aromatic ring-hydroxylating dioxygenase subunit alpha [Candidatus Eremiobacteraceae bacterium]
MDLRNGAKSQLEATLPRDFYFSEDIYTREKEHIFYSEWFCAGREEQIPKAGDYLLLEVAGERILVVRTKDGELRAHFNTCRHRGCQLVLHDKAEPSADSRSGPLGTFPGAIRCPYHAWTYTLEGDLRTAPYLNEQDTFYKEEFSLHPAGIQTWGGFFFLNLSKDKANARGYDLLTQLGPIAQRVARYPLADLRTARSIVYEVNANWKVILENYNECYHCAGVHPELCDIVPAFKKQGGSELDWDRGIPHKEGAFTFTFSGTTRRAPFPGLDEDERIRHKGELIYPNFMLSLAAEHVAAFTLWPRTPTHTTIACDFLFHPTEMANVEFDPSDAIDFWDLVNRQDWRICEGVQRGMASKVFKFGYYAPMESMSLDIRNYIREHLGGS